MGTRGSKLSRTLCVGRVWAQGPEDNVGSVPEVRRPGRGASILLTDSLKQVKALLWPSVSSLKNEGFG